METSEYLKLANALFRKVEDKLDELEEDVDYEKADGKLEMVFENGSSRVVVNTQRAIQEIWLAGGARAWHFKYLEGEQKWFAVAEQEEFYTCLSNMIQERIQKPVSFH